MRPDLGRGRPATDPVGEQEAEAIYRRYWTSDISQRQLARVAARNPKTVLKIVNRAPRLREATAEAAVELGYPEQGPRRKPQGGFS